MVSWGWAISNIRGGDSSYQKETRRGRRFLGKGRSGDRRWGKSWSPSQRIGFTLLIRTAQTVSVVPGVKATDDPVTYFIPNGRRTTTFSPGSNPAEACEPDNTMTRNVSDHRIGISSAYRVPTRSRPAHHPSMTGSLTPRLNLALSLFGLLRRILLAPLSGSGLNEPSWVELDGSPSRL
jgi:hypothetical protein